MAIIIEKPITRSYLSKQLSNHKKVILDEEYVHIKQGKDNSAKVLITDEDGKVVLEEHFGLFYKGYSETLPTDPDDQDLYNFNVPESSEGSGDSMVGWFLWSAADNEWLSLGGSGSLSPADFAKTAIDFTTEIRQL